MPENRTIRETFAAHQSLTKSAKGDGQKHLSENRSEVSPEASFSEQLYFFTLLVNKVTKNETQTSVKIKMVSHHCKKPLLCKANTVVEKTLYAEYLQATLPKVIQESWWHF